MGYRNQQRACHYAIVHRLDDRARLVLVGMCERIPDDDPPPLIYEKGWPYLAIVWLGFDRYDNSAQRATARVIERLDTRYGALKTLRTGRPGQAAAYELLIPEHYGRDLGWWHTYL